MEAEGRNYTPVKLLWTQKRVIPRDALHYRLPNKDYPMYSTPIAYFITFTIRGTWLHGKSQGSYGRKGQFIESNPALEHFERSEMANSPASLTIEQRVIVRLAIQDYCHKRSWKIYAFTVQPTHVHIALAASDMPKEQVARLFKSAATFRLRKAGEIGQDVKPWTRNSSERLVFDEKDLRGVIEYINDPHHL